MQGLKKLYIVMGIVTLFLSSLILFLALIGKNDESVLMFILALPYFVSYTFVFGKMKREYKKYWNELLFNEIVILISSSLIGFAVYLNFKETFLYALILAIAFFTIFYFIFKIMRYA